MCAVPVDGLHKEDMTHEQLLKIQALLKRRIPTGKHDCSCTAFATYWSCKHPPKYIIQTADNPTVQLSFLYVTAVVQIEVYARSGQLWQLVALHITICIAGCWH